MRCECNFLFSLSRSCDRLRFSGRNVCWYYLIGACKFGERCSYLHSKEYLLQKGWWSTAAGVDKEKKRYNLIQMCNKGIADYNSQTKASGTKQTSNKKQPKGKKKRSHRSRSGVEGKSPALHSYSGWGGYDSNGYDENGMFGFTGSDVEELLCQGVKPWDDDAWVRVTRPAIHRDLHFPLQGCHGRPPWVLTAGVVHGCLISSLAMVGFMLLASPMLSE